MRHKISLFIASSFLEQEPKHFPGEFAGPQLPPEPRFLRGGHIGNAPGQGNWTSPPEHDSPIGQHFPDGPHRFDGAQLGSRENRFQVRPFLKRWIGQVVAFEPPLSVDRHPEGVHIARIGFRPRGQCKKGHSCRHRKNLPGEGTKSIGESTLFPHTWCSEQASYHSGQPNRVVAQSGLPLIYDFHECQLIAPMTRRQLPGVSPIHSDCLTLQSFQMILP